MHQIIPSSPSAAGEKEKYQAREWSTQARILNRKEEVGHECEELEEGAGEKANLSLAKYPCVGY